MTDLYFFDTDCISAFLWIRNESILAKLYPGKIILPSRVYDEIQKVPPLAGRIENMINNNQMKIEYIYSGTEEYKDFFAMTVKNDTGKIVGEGEAAAIVLAKKYNGILASNNFRDIMPYIDKFDLKYITTADILVEALENKIITEDEGNDIWENMKKRRRMLPNETFSEYLKLKKKGENM